MDHPRSGGCRSIATLCAAAFSLILLLVGGASAAGDYRYSQPDWGVDFLHAGNREVDANFAESMGSGVCVLDYDGDSWEDLFFVNGKYADAALQAERDPRSALYRNLGGRGFERVPGALELSTWGAGCATGDYDADGRVDVALNAWGGAQLFRNLGGGAFENATGAAGIWRDRCGDFACFGSSIAFMDYDLDADLDLYVMNYVEWDGHSTDNPTQLPGQCNVMWRNEGDGTFTDATSATGTADCGLNHVAPAIADVDGDGWQDIFVANDATENTFLLNNGDGTFRSEADSAIALDDRAGMGAAWGDYDGDGRQDVVITHFDTEGWALYRQNADGTFTDRAREDGLYDPTLDYIGWGAEFVDYDFDGDLDLALASGPPNATFSYLAGYGQKNFLLKNDGTGRFVEDEAAWDPEPVLRVSRGIVFADLDQDGYPDLVVANNADELAEAWRSQRGPNNWLALRLTGNATVNPQAVGAVVEVEAGGLTLRREVVAIASYASQSTRDLQFGLADATRADRVSVRWPDGTEQTFENVAANQLLALAPGGALTPLRERPLASAPAAVVANRVDAVLLVGESLRDLPGLSHRWTVGGATYEGAEASVAFAELGTFEARYRVTDASGAWDEVVVAVTVTNLPPEPLVALPPLVEGGRPAALDASASRDRDGSVLAWAWEVEGVAYSGRVVEHAFSRPGVHELRLTVTDDDGAEASTTFTVDVQNGAPEARIAAPAEADRTRSVTFDASASLDLDGEVVAWRWYFGDGTIAGGESASHRYRALGTFTVTLTVTDDLGREDSATTTVVVVNLPPIARVTGYDLANVDQLLAYDGSTSDDPDGAVVAWSWSFDGQSAVGGVAASHAFPEAGARVVTLTVRDDDGAEASASWAVDVVDWLAVVASMDAASFAAAEAPQGTVEVRFANGLPAAGADVTARIRYRADAPLPAGAPDAAPYDRAVSGTTDAEGRLRLAAPAAWPEAAGGAGAPLPHVLAPTETRTGETVLRWAEYRVGVDAAWRANAGAAASAFGVTA